MNAVYLFISISILFFYLNAGVFILKQNPKKTSVWMLSCAMFSAALYSFSTIVAYQMPNKEEFITITKGILIFAEFGTLFWMVASFYIRADSGKKDQRQLKLIALIAILDLLFILLTAFTKIFIDYSQVQLITFNHQETWSDPPTKLYYIRIFLNIAKLMIPIANFRYLLSISKNASDKLYNPSKQFYAAALILLIGVTGSVALHYYSIWKPDIYYRFSYISDLSILVALSLVIYSIIFYDSLLEQKKKSVKSFSFSSLQTFYLHFHT